MGESTGGAKGGRVLVVLFPLEFRLFSYDVLLMKAALCASLVFVSVLATLAAESAHTAYSALRVIGKQNGSDTLNRVVEVRGRFGAPEPETWKVTLEEASARGGLRELEVQRGQLVGEKTPVARSVGTPMNFNQLNLDSEGAFTVVNQEMQKAAITFDRVDYLLRSGAQGGAPLWHIDLFLGQGGRVAQFDIAADTGNVMKRDLHPKEPRSPIADDHAYAQNPPPPLVDAGPRRRYDDDPRRNPEDFRYQTPDEARPAPEGDDDEADDPTPFVDRVSRHLEKRSRQFKNFFSGRGWSAR